MMKFNLFGIKVSISFSTVLLVTFSVVTAGTGQTLVFLCILSALLHELGHLVFIYKYKGKPDMIVVNLFEIKICSDLQLSSKWKELIITSAGIISNIVVSSLAYVMNSIFPCHVVFDFALCNLVIAAMNLLPVQSFDGGQLLYFFLSGVTGDKFAYNVVLVLTVLIMFPIAALGVFVLFTSRHNYSLLFVFLYLLSIFISKELR